MRERKRIRLRGFDYSIDNLYFITTCVQDRVCCFGEIRRPNVDGDSPSPSHSPRNNDVGTGRDLSQSPSSSPSSPSNSPRHNDVGTGHDLSHIQSNNDASTGHDLSLRQTMVLNEYGIIAAQQWDWLEKQYPYVVLHAFVVMPNHVHGIIEIKRDSAVVDRKIKSLSELKGAYKTTVSKKIHLLGNTGFAWQRSFYEHIIRDERSFETISDYIENNPIKWNQDKFFNP